MAAISSSAAIASAPTTTTSKPTLIPRRPTAHLSFHHPLSLSSSTSATLSLKTRTSPHPSLRKRWLSAVVGEERAEHVTSTTATAAAEEEEEEEKVQVPEGKGPEGFKLQVRPCELYVCNIPRSCDIPDLVELFKPFGTVQSVEVCRDSETGVSRGCGYVTMRSLADAKNAIAKLDGSDLGGRELRVKFSADMVRGRKNTAAQSTVTKKDVVFESPHKAYVGNIPWSAKPEDLREYFSQYGTVVSTRLLYDRKSGKNRVYGFLSFSAKDELEAAVASSGTNFQGRELLVRQIVME